MMAWDLGIKPWIENGTNTWWQYSCKWSVIYELEWRMKSHKDSLAREYAWISKSFDSIIIEILEYWLRTKTINRSFKPWKI